LPLLPYKGKILAKHIWRRLEKSELNWDPWILKDGEIYRLFYLRGANRSIRRPWWKIESKIYGAISTNLKNWEDIGVILEPDPANSWESGRLMAGSTYKEDGIYYLFYSASGKDFMNEAIGLATSIDGLHWQRSSTAPLLKPDDQNYWYENSYHFQWRDPYIVREDRTGKYYMFVTASSKDHGGCIGLAVADKISGPYELLPPVTAPSVEGTSESIYYEMERPQVIYKAGKYHLFFSAFLSTLNSKWIHKVGRDKLSDSTLYWYVADSLSSSFKPISNKPIVEGSEHTGIYGTNFLQTSDKPDEFIAYGWRHRLFSLELSAMYQVVWGPNKIEITRRINNKPK
jgi:beta-fructofuranosidase